MQCSPQDFDTGKARGRGIVDKGSLRDGPLALIVTFVAECSMIMPLPS